MTDEWKPGDHPRAWCGRCDREVPAVFRHGIYRYRLHRPERGAAPCPESRVPVKVTHYRRAWMDAVGDPAK